MAHPRMKTARACSRVTAATNDRAGNPAAFCASAQRNHLMRKTMIICSALAALLLAGCGQSGSHHRKEQKTEHVKVDKLKDGSYAYYDGTW